MVSRGQEVRVRREDGLLELGIADLRVAIQVKTPDDGKQLRFEGLMAHFLEEDAEATLGKVAHPDLINGFKDPTGTEVIGGF